MAEPTKGERQTAVEKNIADIVAKYGEEAFDKIANQCIQDISVSLALLVDGSNSDS